MSYSASLYQNRIFRGVVALLIVFVLVIAAFPNATGRNATPVVTFTPVASARQQPTVPPGGSVVSITRTYFHTSGYLSVPKIDGWDPPGGGGEETNLAGDASFQRVGLMFINSPAQSVVHTFAERDPAFLPKDLSELNARYDTKYMDQAWKDYTGGWRELARRTEGDMNIIDLELKVTTPAPQGGGEFTDVYLARQIAKISNGWVMVTRLVAPQNNPDLLDRLQTAVEPNFRLYPAALSGPPNWSSITDYALGYVIKFPSGWNLVEGRPGSPYIVEGVLNGQVVTMTTRVQPAAQIADAAAASEFVAKLTPKAANMKSTATGVNGLNGFIVTYGDPDPDGNLRSAATMLLNGAGKLYIITQQYAARGLDLTDVNNVNLPPELRLSRESFFAIPAEELAITATPLPTNTPAPTLTPAP